MLRRYNPRAGDVRPLDPVKAQHLAPLGASSAKEACRCMLLCASEREMCERLRRFPSRPPGRRVVASTSGGAAATKSVHARWRPEARSDTRAAAGRQQLWGLKGQ